MEWYTFRSKIKWDYFVKKINVVDSTFIFLKDIYFNDYIYYLYGKRERKGGSSRESGMSREKEKREGLKQRERNETREGWTKREEREGWQIWWNCSENEVENFKMK